MDYQDVCSEHARTNWQVSSLTFSTSVIPTCFKQATIVPVPKKVKVTCLNDYYPIAFERLVKAHINTIIPETLYIHFNLHTAPTASQMMPYQS